MPQVLPPLKLKERADLYSQLGTMEAAGVPVEKALKLVRLGPKSQRRLERMARAVASGISVAASGLRTGTFTVFDASLLDAATKAGRSEDAYHRLSEHYARKAHQAAAIKSRLMLPLVMLIVSIFVQPLPKIFEGSQTLTSYLLQGVCKLALLAAATFVFIEWLPRLRERPWSGRAGMADAFLSSVPLIGPLHERRAARDFFVSLALLLEAGMPVLQALPIACHVVQNQSIRKLFLRIAPMIENGSSFARALGMLGFAGRTQALSIILPGEESGRMPEMIARYADAESLAIHQFDDALATWIPRIAYSLVALMIGYGILTSGAFMPTLPADLR